MGELIFIVILIVLLIVFTIYSFHARKTKKQHDEEEKKAELASLRKKLLDFADTYNQQVKKWREYHAKYEHLGMPTTSVGYSLLEGYIPWEQPTVSIHFDESDPSIDTQIEWAKSSLEVYPVTYHLPNIDLCVSFYKEARLALFGNFEFKPEQLRFIKSRADKALGIIIVTITTTELEYPTFTLEYPYDERETVDELKAAFNAFKTLK